MPIYDPRSPVPTTKTGFALAAKGVPVYGGGPKPSIFVGSQTKPVITNSPPFNPGTGYPTNPRLPAGTSSDVPMPTNSGPIWEGMPGAPSPGPQPLGAFDFSPFENMANYHETPEFQAGWDETFKAVGALSPEQRAQFDELYAQQIEGVQAGGGRGINVMRDAYNQVIGASPTDSGSLSDVYPTESGAEAGGISNGSSQEGVAENAGFAAQGFTPAPAEYSRPGGLAAQPNPAHIRSTQRGREQGPSQGGKRSYPRLEQRKKRRAAGMRPTIANEGNQMPAVRPQGPPAFLRGGRGMAY